MGDVVRLSNCREIPPEISKIIARRTKKASYWVRRWSETNCGLYEADLKDMDKALAENASQLEKGTSVLVIGRLESREYEDRDKNKRTAWEVTADAFGPDLRFQAVTVTRTGGSGGGSAPQSGGWDTAPVPGAQTGVQGFAEFGSDTPF